MDNKNAEPVGADISSEKPGNLGPADQFMLEEYKNISKAHYELDNGFRQMIRFYLGIVAVPVTLFAFAYKDTQIDIGALPRILVFILMLVAGLGFLMFLSIINIRFDLVLYVRAVNGTRKYFVDLNHKVNSSDLRKYLVLPDQVTFPPYRETFGAYWWQFFMISLLNSVYLTVGLKNFYSWSQTVSVSLAFWALHVAFYLYWAHKRSRASISARP